MTQTANITWELPTTRSNGQTQVAPLTAVVSFSADLGANFVELLQVPDTDPQSLVIPDLVDGDYLVRIVLVDASGQGAPVDTPFVIDQSVPGNVINVQVALT